jgi:hypothetical protein
MRHAEEVILLILGTVLLPGQSAGGRLALRARHGAIVAP